MKTRKKRGGIFNSGTRRLKSRLRSRLKYFKKKNLEKYIYQRIQKYHLRNKLIHKVQKK